MSKGYVRLAWGHVSIFLVAAACQEVGRLKDEPAGRRRRSSFCHGPLTVCRQPPPLCHETLSGCHGLFPVWQEPLEPDRGQCQSGTGLCQVVRAGRCLLDLPSGSHRWKLPRPHPVPLLEGEGTPGGKGLSVGEVEGSRHAIPKRSGIDKRSPVPLQCAFDSIANLASSGT